MKIEDNNRDERYAQSGAEGSAMESLKGDSTYGLIRRWSTPSVGDFGINRKYLEGDQNVWMIKCGHCGKWQEIDFDKNIEIVDDSQIDRAINVVRPGATRYVCQYCGKNIEADRWYSGAWVPKKTDKGRSKSFFISQTDAVWISSDAIYRDSLRAVSKQLFYNYTLGKPYENSTLSVKESDIVDNMRIDIPEPVKIRTDMYSYITAGIDWGTEYHHIVILGMRASGAWDILNFYRVPTSHGPEHIEEDLRQVINILNQYDPDRIMPDIGLTPKSL